MEHLVYHSKAGTEKLGGWVYQNKKFKDLGEMFAERYEMKQETDSENLFYTIFKCEKPDLNYPVYLEYLYFDLDSIKQPIENYILALGAFLSVDPDIIAVVFSGRGLQCFVKLDRPINAEFFSLNRNVYCNIKTKFHSYCSKLGLEFDVDLSVYQAKRTLRYPNTVNNNPAKEPKKCNSYVYQPGDFNKTISLDDVFKLGEYVENRKSEFKHSEKTSHFKDKKCIEKLWNTPLTEGSRHATLFRLCLHELLSGTKEQAIVDKIIKLCKLSNVDPKKRGLSQLEYAKNNLDKYDYGCKDYILKSFCTKLCKLHPDNKKENVEEIKPKFIEKKINRAVFPLDGFPIEIQDFLKSTAECLSTHVEYVAVPFLVACSALVGRDADIVVSETWKAKCVFWGMNIGEPGKNKSAPANYIKKIMLGDSADELKKDFNKQYSDFKNKERHIKKMNQISEKIATKDFESGPNEGNEQIFEKALAKSKLLPEPPIESHLIITTPTKEALVSSSDVSPHLTVWVDEISRLFASFEKDPATKDILLECFDGDKSDNAIRKKEKANKAGGLYCNVFGTIQPDKIRDYFMNKSNDGFSQRFFLIAFPSTYIKPKLDSSLKIKNEDYIRILAKNLYNIGKTDFQFHHEALPVFEAIYKKYISMGQNEETPLFMREFYSKAPIYIMRLSLVISLSHCAHTVDKFIRKKSVICAAAVFESFLAPNYETFCECISDTFLTKSQVLLKELKKHNEADFTFTGIYGRYKIKGLKARDDFKAAWDLLIDQGFIVAKNDKKRNGGQVFFLN